MVDSCCDEIPRRKKTGLFLSLLLLVLLVHCHKGLLIYSSFSRRYSLEVSAGESQFALVCGVPKLREVVMLAMRSGADPTTTMMIHQSPVPDVEKCKSTWMNALVFVLVLTRTSWIRGGDVDVLELQHDLSLLFERGLPLPLLVPLSAFLFGERKKKYLSWWSRKSAFGRGKHYRRCFFSLLMGELSIWMLLLPFDRIQVAPLDAAAMFLVFRILQIDLGKNSRRSISSILFLLIFFDPKNQNTRIMRSHHV